MAKTAKHTPAPQYDQPFHAGDRIRKARELIGEDRQTFAETIGVHRDTLAKYEETGTAKRTALISIAWNTPVRLEWLETGELPWLKSDLPDSPRPVIDVKNEGLGRITEVADLAAWRAARRPENTREEVSA